MPDTNTITTRRKRRKWECERCGHRSRNAVQAERHRALHAQLPSNGVSDDAGLPGSAEAIMSAGESASAPAAVGPEEPSLPSGGGMAGENTPPSESVTSASSALPGAPDPRITPFDIPDMPEFERAEAGERTEPQGGAVPFAYPVEEPPPGEPAFSEQSLAAVLKVFFDATAEMAQTGPAGRLSDAEANLISSLSLDWVNRQVAANLGNDPSQAKALVAVGVILATKARVYIVAIRRRGEPAAVAPRNPVDSQATDPDDPPPPPPPSEANEFVTSPPPAPSSIDFGDNGAFDGVYGDLQ